MLQNNRFQNLANRALSIQQKVKLKFYSKEMRAGPAAIQV